MLAGLTTNYLLMPGSFSSCGRSSVSCLHDTPGTVSSQVLALWLDLLRDGGLERALEAGSAAGQIALFHVPRHVFGDMADVPGALLSVMLLAVCPPVPLCLCVDLRAKNRQLLATVPPRMRTMGSREVQTPPE